MIPVVFQDFLIQVRSHTETRVIAWREGEELSFFCRQNGIGLHISKHFDPDRDVGWIAFRVIGKEGRTTPFSVSDDEKDDYEFMDALFQAVVANVNNVEQDMIDFFK